MNSSGKISILVAGAGSIGERHLRCFLRTGRTGVAVCEPNDKTRADVAARYGVETFPDYDTALASNDWSGVVICPPAHLHVPMAKAALECSRAVLIEKPLSISLDGCGELLRLRDRAGVAAGVAYVLRFTPALQQARAFLQTGELGDPLHAATVAGQHFPTFRPAYRNIYYARHNTGGGAIQDALTHTAHSLEWLLGKASSLFCDASHQALEGVEVEDTVNVLARHGPTLVNFALNQFQAPNESHIWIHCEKGSLKIESHRQRWGILRHGETDWSWNDAPVADRDSLFIAQANAFLDEIQGKKTILASLEEGVQTLKFNLAALESSRTGKKVIL